MLRIVKSGARGWNGCSLAVARFGTQFSIKPANNKALEKSRQELKQIELENKDYKPYMAKISDKRIDQIGSKSLLDKKWNDRPVNVIKNPHKLSEVELYKTLEKIVEMPEKKLLNMVKSGNFIDEVFLKNLADRIPQFLSVTLVKITRILLMQKDYFRDHPIWLVLEQELFKRRNTLNNEQLSTVMHSFGVSGNGSKEFFYEMEEVITDSPIPIETEYLQKMIKGYSEVDQGTPVFYSMLIEKILDRGIELLTIE